MKYAVYYKDELYKHKRTIKSAETLIAKLACWDKALPCDFYVWTRDKDGELLKLRVDDNFKLADWSWVTFTNM